MLFAFFHLLRILYIASTWSLIRRNLDLPTLLSFQLVPLNNETDSEVIL